MLYYYQDDLMEQKVPEQHDMGRHDVEQPAPPPLGSLGDLAAPQPVLLRGLGSFLHAPASTGGPDRIVAEMLRWVDSQKYRNTLSIKPCLKASIIILLPQSLSIHQYTSPLQHRYSARTSALP